MAERDKIIEVIGVGNYLGGNWVHKGLNLTVARGEIIAIIGASGCGKTTLLRSILMLREFSEGQINVFGMDVGKCSEMDSYRICQHSWVAINFMCKIL